MTEYWHLFVFLAGLIAAWSGVIMLSVRLIVSRSLSVLDERLAELKCIKDDQQRLERSVMELRADLPIHYVRKEDFVRHEVVINAKLDRLRDLVEDIREEGRKK